MNIDHADIMRIDDIIRNNHVVGVHIGNLYRTGNTLYIIFDYHMYYDMMFFTSYYMSVQAVFCIRLHTALLAADESRNSV